MVVVSVTVVSGIEVARVVRLSPEYVLIAQVMGQAIGPYRTWFASECFTETRQVLNFRGSQNWPSGEKSSDCDQPNSSRTSSAVMAPDSNSPPSMTFANRAAFLALSDMTFSSMVSLATNR